MRVYQISHKCCGKGCEAWAREQERRQEERQQEEQRGED
jgi:hypothetical protein